jgi:hypothetical protein
MISGTWERGAASGPFGAGPCRAASLPLGARGCVGPLRGRTVPCRVTALGSAGLRRAPSGLRRAPSGQDRAGPCQAASLPLGARGCVGPLRGRTVPCQVLGSEFVGS